MGGRYGYLLDCQYEHVPVGDSDHYGVLPDDAVKRTDPVFKTGMSKLQISNFRFQIEKKES
jgi:hypothetical protein